MNLTFSQTQKGLFLTKQALFSRHLVLNNNSILKLTFKEGNTFPDLQNVTKSCSSPSKRNVSPRKASLTNKNLTKELKRYKLCLKLKWHRIIPSLNYLNAITSLDEIEWTEKTCHYTKKHIISFLFAVRLYLAPPMLKLLHQKYRMERREGVGKEVGQLEIHDMLTNNLSFSEIHKKFRRYHTVIAVGNLLTVVCTFVHLHYLASKIVAL